MGLVGKFYSFKSICASKTLTYTSQSWWGNAAAHSVRRRGLCNRAEEGQVSSVPVLGRGRARETECPGAGRPAGSACWQKAESELTWGGLGRQSMALGHRPAGPGPGP